MSSLIITRHGHYDRLKGDLCKGEREKIGTSIAMILDVNHLKEKGIGVLTSPEERAIQTGEGIVEANPNCFLLDPLGNKLVISSYPFKDERVDISQLSIQTQVLLFYLRKRVHELEGGIILVGHEPSIMGLSKQLNLGLDRKRINIGDQLPMVTRI